MWNLLNTVQQSIIFLHGATSIMLLYSCIRSVYLFFRIKCKVYKFKDILFINLLNVCFRPEKLASFSHESIVGIMKMLHFTLKKNTVILKKIKNSVHNSREIYTKILLTASIFHKPGNYYFLRVGVLGLKGYSLSLKEARA